MTETAVLACSTEGCPVAESGRCLEGFDPPTDCPHLLPESSPTDEAVVSEEETDPEQKIASEDGGAKADVPTVELGGGESLTLPLADQVALRYGAQVVLVAGDFQSGKTTLLAELYGRFLKGRYEGWTFAGSDCIRALDARFHGTREGSGLAHPDVPRTEDEEMRLVDLRVDRNGAQASLMLSDIRGELFDSVVEGAPVGETIPLAARADKLVVLVDGEKVADDFKRPVASSWCKQLIGGLTETGGVQAGIPSAVVLSKADLVDDEHSRWFMNEAAEVRDLAVARGLGAPEIFSIAARPDSSPHEPLDLPPLFHWLVSKVFIESMSPPPALAAGPSFLRWNTDVA